MVDRRKLVAGTLTGLLLLPSTACSEETGDLDFPADVDGVPPEVDDGLE